MLRFSALTALLVACASQAQPPVASAIASAASEANVPADLLLAIAAEEGGLVLPALRIPREDDQVPVAGALELRHGKLDTLALGAALLGTTQAALRTDTDLATRAGARVVASLGATGDLATWQPMLEKLAGMDETNARAYASRVLRILRDGGSFAARDGEIVRIAPHPEVVVPDVTPDASTPDYPGAIWFTTSCTDKCDVGRPLGNASVNKIVIHDTEGGWDGSVATLQNDSGKSVHYIVDADGSRVGQFRPETDTTWHAGNYYYNETSIGIEHVGTAANPAGYAAGLYATSKKLVKSIRTRWTIPLDRTHIVGHYQIPNGNDEAESSAPCTATLDTCETSDTYGGADNHRDPGYHWQWCEYMQSLGGSCTCNDTYAMWNCTTDLTEAVRCTSGTVEIEPCTGGCEVMPVGTADVCHTAMTAMPPDAGIDAADGDASTGDPDEPTSHHTGSCATTDASASLLVLLAAIAIATRSRRC